MRGCTYHDVNVRGCRWCDRILSVLSRRELYAQALGAEMQDEEPMLAAMLAAMTEVKGDASVTPSVVHVAPWHLDAIRQIFLYGEATVTIPKERL